MLNSENIKSYWIQANDDGTFSIDIETDCCEMIYSNARIEFYGNGLIAFPVSAEILDRDGNKKNTFSLIKPDETSENGNDEENKE